MNGNIYAMNKPITVHIRIFPVPALRHTQLL